MVTRFATSPPTDNCPQPKEAQPLSQLDIHLYNILTPRLCGLMLWFDGPEVALIWLLSLSHITYNPPLLSECTPPISPAALHSAKLSHATAQLPSRHRKLHQREAESRSRRLTPQFSKQCTTPSLIRLVLHTRTTGPRVAKDVQPRSALTRYFDLSPPPFAWSGEGVIGFSTFLHRCFPSLFTPYSPGGGPTAHRVLTSHNKRQVGYTGFDEGHDNIAWDPTVGVLAYPIHTAVMMEELATRQQRHLSGHAAPVTCLAISAAAGLLASGDAAGCVLLWTLAAGDMVGSLHITGTVTTLSFSPTGRHLACFSGGSEPMAAVWCIQQPEAVATAPTAQPVRGVAWRPGSALTELVTVGATELVVWTLVRLFACKPSCAVSHPAEKSRSALGGATTMAPTILGEKDPHIIRHFRTRPDHEPNRIRGGGRGYG